MVFKAPFPMAVAQRGTPCGSEVGSSCPGCWERPRWHKLPQPWLGGQHCNWLVTGIYRDLIGFNGIYRDLIGFNGYLLGLIGINVGKTMPVSGLEAQFFE